MEIKFKVSLFLVSVLLGGMLTVQFSTVHRPRVDANTGDNVQLTAELAKERERQKFLYSDIEQLESQIQSYQDKEGNRDELLSAMNEELEKVKYLAGMQPVKGNGIVITIEDSFEAISNGGDPNKQIYLGEYLYQLVNYLNGNEAQAISVENHRLVSMSSIRQISKLNLQVNAVMIDPKQITIRAVGNIDQMKIGLNNFPPLFRDMGKDLKVSEVTNGGLEIPGYKQNVELKYAQPEGDKNL